jgi:endoglucanase
MNKLFFFLTVFLSLNCLAQTQTTNFLSVNPNEYLENDQFSVLVFHNDYAVGKQGGIEFILHKKRIATNGFVRIESEKLSEEFVDASQPKNGKDSEDVRIVDNKNNVISVPFDDVWPGFSYTIDVIPLPDGVEIKFKANTEKIPNDIDDIYFEMEFYPGYYEGKPFLSDSDFGVFPYVPVSEMKNEKESGNQLQPMAKGKRFVFAPGDEDVRIEMQGNNCSLELYDERALHSINWFTIRTKADNPNKNEFSIIFKPSYVNGWQKPPMIAYSQVGYHPRQPKFAMVELGKHTKKLSAAQILKIDPLGAEKLVLEFEPEMWGQYLRYKYARIDFSNVREEGLYKIKYGNTKTKAFKIATDVYSKEVWQPTLSTFMPVQMCHMKVFERDKLWHGACHLDDALQVPVPKVFFDGFRQKETTETPFKPETTIPGLNRGGWHDAGDDDINTGSNGRNIYSLALAVEEFGIEVDNTTVDNEKLETYIHQPDGKPDALQQIEFGLMWLLPQFEVVGHSIVGTVSSSYETYLLAGDWSVYTDNLFYKPEFPEGSRDGEYSGKKDDRYAFTNKDTGRDYFCAAIFASSYRVLKNYNPEMARKCLNTAIKIWDYEAIHEPVSYPNVGTPSNWFSEKVGATVELYLSTGDEKYLNELIGDSEKIFADPGNTLWAVSRVVEDIKNKKFQKQYNSSLQKFSDNFSARLAENPFGVVDAYQVWGTGWEVLWTMYKHYYLIKKHPGLFPYEQMYNGVHYQFGLHAASNLSLVSGIGAHKPIPAFGINRHHYSYIPGGVYSGPSKILPDYPELRDDTPYIWQQSEYIISGAGPFIFCVMAAEKFLEQY